MNKAELARRIGATPEIVRRLFTTDSPNPTMKTMVKVAGALGFRLQLVSDEEASAQQQYPNEQEATA